MKIIKMTSLDLKGKRVLIREDLNVPIKDGEVGAMRGSARRCPPSRPRSTAKARVMLMSHLGRPEEGKFAEEFSLAPVARRLTQLLGVPTPLRRDWLDGVDVAPGEVVLLENVRFNKGEKKDDERAVAQNGGALRRLRDGCLRHRASRRSEHARRGEVRAGRLRGTACW